MLIIATIGRSGSSFLAKFFHECKFKMGDLVWFDKVNAGYENKKTLAINQELINHYVKDKPINHYRVWADIYDMNYDVIKDPQFLTHTEIIRNWHHVRDDLKVIFLHREPDEIVESMKRVPEWNSPVYRLFPEMINKKNNEFLDTIIELEIPYIQLKYPDFVNSTTESLKSIEELIKLPNDAPTKWNELNDL